MDLSSHNWFKYINEMRLNEGVRDIGLPEVIVDRIEETLPDASEKAKVWIGNKWKSFYAPNRDNMSVRLGLAVLRPLIDAGIFDNNADIFEDEEGDSEAQTRAKWLIRNISTLVKEKKLGTWKVGFRKTVKNLSKLGIPSETVEAVQETLQLALAETYENGVMRYPSLIALLNTDPTYYEDIKDAESMSAASNIAQDILNDMEHPDQIFHTFEDGSYWYDLRTTNCPIEASRMGHCGAEGEATTLFSLRKHEGRKKRSKSFVTVSYDQHNDTIYQIKGRSNSVPPEETWEHIAWLVNELGVTQVHESGEHSDDEYEFPDFLEWLDLHTESEISGGADKAAEMEEALSAIEHDAAYETGDGVVTSYGYHVVDDEPQHPYYYYEGSVRYQINLGWANFARDGDEYVPVTADDERDESNKPIPVSHWGYSNPSGEFRALSGIETLSDDLPNSADTATEYTITMLVPVASSDWEYGDPEPPATAHLIVSFDMQNETSTDPGDYDYWITELESLDRPDTIKEVENTIRANLSAEGYAEKTAWDTSRAELEEMEENLTYFSTLADNNEVDFFFKYAAEGPLQHALKAAVSIPTLLKPWLYFGGSDLGVRQHHSAAISHQLFGGRSSGQREWIVSENLSGMFAGILQAELNRLVGPDPRQQALPLGDRYSYRGDRIMLDAENVVFKIKTWLKEKEPLTFEYTVSIRIPSAASQGEITGLTEVVEMMDKNPTLVVETANKIIATHVDAVVKTAEEAREEVLRGPVIPNALATIERTYGQQAADGDNGAEKIMILASWLGEHIDEMNDVEKYVAYFDFLRRMAENRFPVWGPMGEYLQDPLGQPVEFERRVRSLMRSLGGYAPESGTHRTRIGSGPAVTMEDPVPGRLNPPQQAESMAHLTTLTRSMRQARMNESIEDRLQRIDDLLNEADPSYDLRIYKITVGCNVNDDIGGSEAETAAEIRGIAGVTTVRPVADLKKRITPQNEYIPFEIKFELVGAASRVKYRDEVLFPGMRRIKGLKIIDWTSIHRTNVQGTIRTVREEKTRTSLREEGPLAGNFGGLGGALGGQMGKRYPSPARPTPTPTIDELIADWSEGGVQLYDAPSDTTDMAYHVMIPVQELWEYASTYYRGDKPAFDGAYENFIKNGAEAPVYLAIGKNGRAKVTGNEDIIWFAKQAGLEEVPVFISYQRQV